MDSDNSTLLFAPHTGLDQAGDDPWRLLELEDNASSINTTRSLGTVAESEWFRILAQIASSTLLFLLIFGMSATVDVQHLQQQMHNRFAILIGVATQFIVMPLLGYCSVMLLKDHGLTEPMAISLLIVTASPGGSYSNWWCSMFNADLALSVTMTAISTMISTVMLPANLLLYVNAAFGFGSEGEGGESVLKKIDWASLFVSLAIVIVAVALGLLASYKISSHRFNRYANRMGSLSGILLVIFSAVVTSISGKNEAQIWGQPWSFYVGVTSPCLAGLCIATIFGAMAKLKKPEVISVGVECCYQNVGIATSAAVAMFDDPMDKAQALCVPLFYGLMEAMVLGVYCIIAWKLGWTKAPRDEKFCVMVVTTYEVEEDTGVDEFPTMDEERQQEHDSAAVITEVVPSPDTTWVDTSLTEHKPSWRWPWTLFFRKRKRKTSDETQLPAALSSPKMASLPPIGGGLDTVSPMDSITDLVSFDQKYSRCRMNSEDSGLTTAISESNSDSPNSRTSPTTTAASAPISLMTGQF